MTSPAGALRGYCEVTSVPCYRSQHQPERHGARAEACLPHAAGLLADRRWRARTALIDLIVGDVR